MKVELLSRYDPRLFSEGRYKYLVPDKEEELNMGIPCKGPLLDDSNSLLERAGLYYQKAPRQVVAESWVFDPTTFANRQDSIDDAIPEGVVNLAFIRQRDIIRQAETGGLDMGIVGSDAYKEEEPFGGFTQIVGRLGFGRCNLVVAVRNVPNTGGFFRRPGEITSLKDLAGKKIGTRCPRTVKDFFASEDIPVKIVEVEGAEEGMIEMGWADAVVVIKETGRSLKQNGLKEIGTIGQAEAVLIATPLSIENKGAERFFNLVKQRLLVARDTKDQSTCFKTKVLEGLWRFGFESSFQNLEVSRKIC